MKPIDHSHFDQMGSPGSPVAPHVFYVWFDALIGYLSAVGGPEFEERGLWPADLHIVGKGNYPLSCRVLARILDGCGPAATRANLGSRMAAF